MPFTSNKALYTYNCIYTQTLVSAHQELHVTMCRRTSHSLKVIRCIPNKKTKQFMTETLLLSMLVRQMCMLSPRFMSGRQVGVSLCCLGIAHILSSMLAGMDYSRRIWVIQNLTTERGTSWGPAEENKAQYKGLRRQSGHRFKHLTLVE